MNNETKKDYLEIPMEQMSGCFHNNTQKLDLYNLTKNEKVINKTKKCNKKI